MKIIEMILAVVMFTNICCNNSISPSAKEITRDSLLDKGLKNSKDSSLKISLEHEKNQVKDKIDSIQPTVIDLKKVKKIEILSLNREVTKSEQTDEKDLEKCKSWMPSKNQLEKILRKFVPISSEEAHLSYEHWPCRVTGQIRIDGKLFEYFLNAGARLWLENSDTSLNFVCPGKKCNSIFLSGEITFEEYIDDDK